MGQLCSRIADRPPKGGRERREGTNLVAYEVDKYRYEPLKLFFVSVVWRAAVSVQAFFDRVKIGRYEQAAKALLMTGHAGTPEEFSVTLCKLTGPLNQMFLDPHLQRIDGVNFCQIYLGGYVAYIKLDKRPTPSPFNQLILRPASMLKIVARDMRESKHEMRAVGKIMQSPQNARKSLFRCPDIVGITRVHRIRHWHRQIVFTEQAQRG